MRFIRMMSAVVAVLILVSTLMSCNTYRGMKQDIRRGGQKLQDIGNKR